MQKDDNLNVTVIHVKNGLLLPYDWFGAGPSLKCLPAHSYSLLILNCSLTQSCLTVKICWESLFILKGDAREIKYTPVIQTYPNKDTAGAP